MAHGLRCPWHIKLPRLVIEATSPALAGRFLAFGPPGTSHLDFLVSLTFPTFSFLLLGIVEANHVISPMNVLLCASLCCL